MTYAELFNKVESELGLLQSIPHILQKAKQLKSFKIMLNSIQNALRDQITEQLGVDPEHVDEHFAREFDARAQALGVNMELIFRRLSKRLTTDALEPS